MKKIIVQKQEIVFENQKTSITISDILNSDVTFRMLFEHNNSIMTLLDPYYGKIIDVNPAAAKFYGYSRDKLRSMYINQINMLSSEIIQDAMIKGIKEGSTYIFPHKLSNGEIRTVEVLNSAIKIKGKFILINIINDITHRIEMENALRESEEKYRTLFEEDPNYGILLRTDGIIIDVNKNATKLLGLSKKELIGKHYSVFTKPEDIEFRKDKINSILQGKLLEPFEFRFINKKGDIFWIKVNLKPVMNNEKVIYIILIGLDITENKKAENKLQESEKKYRDLAELLPQTIFETDLNGNITFVNRVGHQIFGYDPEELVKEVNMIQILVPEDRARAMKNNQRILSGERLPFGEFTALKKDGTSFQIIVNTNPIIFEDKIIGLRGILVDITELKEAENKIKTSLKEKETLLMEIHHRVKNNMQIISSLLNLQKKYVDDEEAVNVLQESQNRVRSMAIIHENLYQSKDLTHINFVHYIQSLVYNLFYSYNIKETQIKPILKIEDINLNMETAVPCGLIISEIISNSLKYAFPNEMKGEIIVSLKSKNDSYQLCISDNGIGLPEDINFDNIKTLGILLVNTLTEQIDGKVTIYRDPGTRYEISFKEQIYKERI